MPCGCKSKQKQEPAPAHLAALKQEDYPTRLPREGEVLVKWKTPNKTGLFVPGDNGRRTYPRHEKRPFPMLESDAVLKFGAEVELFKLVAEDVAVPV